MLTFKVPPEKQQEGLQPVAPSGKKGEKSWPKITVPASAEIVRALEMGQAVEICMIGSVAGLRSIQGGWEGDRDEVTIELRAIEVEDSTDADESEEDDGEDPMKAGSMQDAISRELDSPAKQKARAARKE